MDFLWFWVSLGLGVEVVRQSYQYFAPKKPRVNESLTEPLLHEDGSCHLTCCAKENSGDFETDYDEYETSTSDDGEADEVMSPDEIMSSDEIEEFEESLTDKRKGKRLADEYQGIGEIVGTLYPRNGGRPKLVQFNGTLYPGNGGRPKLVHFKWNDNHSEVLDNTGGRGLKRESSDKVHPQPFNGTAEEGVLDGSADNSSPQHAKDMKHCIAPPALSDVHTLRPPIQEVMHYGHIPSGEEIQPAEGTVPTPK